LKINRYLSRLYDTILSRSEIQIEAIHLERLAEDQGLIVADLRFFDGSMLSFDERVHVERGRVVKIKYRYHYQRADGTLIFRYDNAPHHPEVSTFPDHIHIEGSVEATEPPDLSNVLRRIDGLLYPTGQQNNTLSNQAEERKSKS
jgi:hypothetical protein